MSVPSRVAFVLVLSINGLALGQSADAVAPPPVADVAAPPAGAAKSVDAVSARESASEAPAGDHGDPNSVFALSLNELLDLQVTTSGRTEQNLDDAAGSVTVITRQQIADLNARSMREILNVYVPGFDVVPLDFAYGDRINDGIYARGVRNDILQNVLVLWNGETKFNESTWGGSFTLGEQPPENLERIEISRSPVPLFGGTGFTIVNLITREATFEGAEVDVQGALNEHSALASRGMLSKRATAILGKTLGNWHVGGSVQLFTDDGQPQRNAAGRGGYPYNLDSMRDGTFYAHNFTLSVRSKDDTLAVETWYKYTRQHSFLAGLVPSQSTDLYGWWAPAWLTLVRYSPLPGLTLNLGNSVTGWGQAYHLTTGPAGGNENNIDTYLEALYTQKFSGLGEHNFVAGAKVEREGQYFTEAYTWDGAALQGSRDPSVIWVPNDFRQIYSLFAEDSWRFLPELAVTGGVRADYFDGFGGQTELAVNPRAALVANLFDRRLTLKALYASAVRPPAIYERLGANVYPLKGSVNTRSEQLQTMEFSAIYRVNSFKAQVTPFFSILNHRIAYVTDAEGLNVAQNTGQTQVYGLDVDLRHYFTERTYAFANGTIMRSETVDDGRETDFLPSTYINGGVNWNWRDLNVNASVYYRSKRPLPANLTSNRANSSYVVMPNLAATYALFPGFQVYGNIENVPGRENQIPLFADGFLYPLRERTYHLGFRGTI